MSKSFVRGYILITLVAAILISVALSSMHIKSIFDAHARFDSHIIEQLYFDAAIFDIEALLNVTHEKHHVDARPHQNNLLKEYVAQNGNYKYFVYDNFSGRLKFETMLHANETLWLGTYSMLMGDDLVSSIYLITNDYKVIGLADQQSVVPTKLNVLGKDFKQSAYWEKYFNCDTQSCDLHPYVTNQYRDELTGDDIITVMLPYRLDHEQYGVVGLDVRTKVLFGDFFDNESLSTPTRHRVTDIDNTCPAYRVCFSKEITLLDSRTFNLSWEYDFVDLVKSIISTNHFIYAFISVTLLMGGLYRLINIFTAHQERDALTKVHTRRVVLNPRLYKQYSYVLMMDIDNFKAINDGYGHDMGDKVLVAFVNHIKKHTRNDDIICRWGGEEFVVLYRTGVDENGMLDIVRRLWSSPLTIQGADLNVTFSGGLVSMGSDISCSVNAADKLLYQVKRNGKNNVMLEANGEYSFLMSKPRYEAQVCTGSSPAGTATRPMQCLRPERVA
ncbi:GGDEF domain-containing protein [Aeromonas rivipollensis]|uniref:GGDEF domain-containing protein n=1 Tax=Aeromonas rivipollensis TaxID=948519 RepID=UPI00372CECF3